MLNLSMFRNIHVGIICFLHIDLQHNVSNLQHLYKVQHSCAACTCTCCWPCMPSASCKQCMVIYNIFRKYKDSCGVHVFTLNQFDQELMRARLTSRLLKSRKLRALSSVLAMLGTLQPRALGPLDLIDSQSNYYLEQSSVNQPFTQLVQVTADMTVWDSTLGQTALHHRIKKGHCSMTGLAS